MRSVPHSRFSSERRRIRSRTSRGSRGRPVGRRERHHQNKRQPRRCQRSTVSGRPSTRCRRCAPVGAQALHHDSEQPVVPAHAGPPTGAQRHRELLPQEQVLQQQRAAITERPAEDAGEERHASEHEAMIADHTVCCVMAPRMGLLRPTAQDPGHRAALL